jgi:nitrite reductase (NADH) large subunit
MKVIIVGNGIAGINVAQGLRNAGPQEGIDIEVYAAEAHPFYARIRLPEVLSGECAPEEITFYKPDWYEKKGITVKTGLPVASIDPDSRRIALLDGTTVGYDYLVLATGSAANHPPIPGSRLAGVHTLRTIEDAAAIRTSLAAHPESAAVIGGGLLGLEAARALKDAGARSVRVFELYPRLLPRQLDETGACLLLKRFAAMGIEVVTCAETAEIVPAADNPGRAGGIRLKDGRVFPSETTILSMGVKPSVELAAAAGLAVKRGIVVDSSLRTSDPYIFAVGDCAEFCGIVWGIIPAALEQAPVAARAILASAGLIPNSAATPYAQTVPKTALKVAGVELLSLGKAVLTDEETASGAYEVMDKVREADGRYEKYVLARGDGDSFVLVGAIVYGSKKHQAPAQKLIGKAVTRHEIEALLDE